MHQVVRGVLPAYILAGGRSTRFGSDKARACVNGEPLIVRQARRLRAIGCDVIVVARESGRYADLGLRTIADLVADLGPLGGLRTALAHRGDGWLVLSSCDLIEIDRSWIDALLVVRDGKPDACAIAFRDDRWQPFPGLYHTRLLSQDDVWSGSMQSLLTAAGAVATPAPDDPPILQANAPDDLPD